MQKSLIALCLGLAASLAGTSVLAKTGTINFEGMITASTCPIDIVNPGDGSIGNVVRMGSIDAKHFTAANQERGARPFALRVTGGAGCTITPASKATVTFNGTPDASGDYFAVTPTADGARNVVLVIKDKTGAALAPGSASAEYALTPTVPTDMRFDAYYRSTAITVTAGVASADVSFIVDIK